MAKKDEMVDYGAGVKVPREDVMKAIYDLHHEEEPMGDFIMKLMPVVGVIISLITLIVVCVR